jgi:hypothetical protein
MLETVSCIHETYVKGKIYEITDAIAVSFLGAKHAEISLIPPDFVKEIQARMALETGKNVLYLPFCGEFGHLIMSHIRLVHFSKAKTKVVCCREGEQVLFPTASSFVTDWVDPIKDEERIATLRDSRIDWPEITQRYPSHLHVESGKLSQSQEVLPIEPATRIKFRPQLRDMVSDVVLGVRTRQNCSERNWQHFERVAEALTKASVSFSVIGERTTSRDLPGQWYHSGDFDTDAAIELLMNCKLFVGTDSGASHLAATVGANMLVFREELGGSRNLVPRMQIVNPKPITCLTGVWNKPQAVIDSMFKQLERQQTSQMLVAKSK